MAIRDGLVSWFIRNIIIPRNEIIDIPGFIVLKLSDDKYTINLREVLLPEKIFLEIENQIVKEHGDNGKQLLYSVGKKFGYRFAQNSNYPNIKNSSEKACSKFAFVLIRYIEAIYAKKINHEIDFKEKTFEIKSDGYIVCSKNGLGLILTDGAISGIWSYVLGEPTVEGVQTKCQGRGDGLCEIICGPEPYLEKHRIMFFREQNMSNLGVDRKKYNYINSMKVRTESKKSLKDLVNSGTVTHKGGVIEFMGDRMLLIESSIMYLLERELKGMVNGEKILWNVGYSYGKHLAKKIGKQGLNRFLRGTLPGFGFGDVLVMEAEGKYSITLNHFPWTRWSKEIDFVLLRSMISGIISGCSNKNVNIKNVKKNISSNGLTLVLD